MGPWDESTAVNPLKQGVSPKVRGATAITIAAALILVVPFFARRNVRLGRGDRRGAARVGTATCVFAVLAWLGSAHLPADSAAVLLLGNAVAYGAAFGVFAWVGYLALEPYLRRQTPELLIGWARVLEGRWSDPRVGSDLLWGTVLASASVATFYLINGLPTWFSFATQTTVPALSTGPGRMSALGALSQLPLGSLMTGLGVACFAFLLRVVVKREGLVFAGLWLVGAGLAWGAENLALEAPGSIVAGLCIALVATRFGLLATAGFALVVQILRGFPLLFTSPWYAPYAAIALVLVLALAIASFRVSLGGQPVFGGSLDA
jgi:hypothetical protein